MSSKTNHLPKFKVVDPEPSYGFVLRNVRFTEYLVSSALRVLSCLLVDLIVICWLLFAFVSCLRVVQTFLVLTFALSVTFDSRCNMCSSEPALLILNMSHIWVNYPIIYIQAVAISLTWVNNLIMYYVFAVCISICLLFLMHFYYQYRPSLSNFILSLALFSLYLIRASRRLLAQYTVISKYRAGIDHRDMRW